LGVEEGALGPWALEFKTAMRASGMRHGRGWLDAGALCSAALALLCMAAVAGAKGIMHMPGPTAC